MATLPNSVNDHHLRCRHCVQRFGTFALLSAHLRNQHSNPQLAEMSRTRVRRRKRPRARHPRAATLHDPTMGNADALDPTVSGDDAAQSMTGLTSTEGDASTNVEDEALLSEEDQIMAGTDAGAFSNADAGTFTGPHEQTMPTTGAQDPLITIRDEPLWCLDGQSYTTAHGVTFTNLHDAILCNFDNIRPTDRSDSPVKAKQAIDELIRSIHYDTPSHQGMND